jgi:hypothetical protein
MVQPVAEPDQLQLGSRPLERIRAPGKLQRNRDILERGHRRQQVEGLEDDADSAAPSAGKPVLIELREVRSRHPHPPGGGALEPGQDRHQRGLARSRWPQDRDALAAADLQVDPAQHVDARCP